MSYWPRPLAMSNHGTHYFALRTLRDRHMVETKKIFFRAEFIKTPLVSFSVMDISYNTQHPLHFLITLIFSRCHRSFAAWTPVKHDQDKEHGLWPLSIGKETELGKMDLAVREVTKCSSIFSATNICSNIISILKRHDTIRMKLN